MKHTIRPYTFAAHTFACWTLRGGWDGLLNYGADEDLSISRNPADDATSLVRSSVTDSPLVRATETESA